ncbi:HAMP domain-containing sensor histidine kinase [Psychrobacter sp.]|uniref:sensor histidine kinase n=1 Tax=Psychrobacter sp. TaxID=56811 RepID=UPI00344CE6A7
MHQFEVSAAKASRSENKSLDSLKVDENSGVEIYKLSDAPKILRDTVTPDIHEINIRSESGKKEGLYYFKYLYQGQYYVLAYRDIGSRTDDMLYKAYSNPSYPVLSLFEQLEKMFYNLLIGVLLLSIIMAYIFSSLSSKTIIKPLLDLKDAVESDQYNLNELTHLPSEVGILARAIDDKNNKLEQYLKREQLFTGDVSHELRTPLTIIMGASEVLQSQLQDNPKACEFTERITNTAKDTSEIISALLLLSRSPEQLDAPLTCINQIAAKEANRLSYLLQFKPVRCHIEADNDYTTQVRPELLKMALGNLIKNAFQYTDSGEVLIHIDNDKISVADTGIGIPDNMMPLLYERFERIEPENLKTEGSGLGLSIVQRIMAHLDWKLTHTTNESGGSTFSIYYH